MNPTSNFNGNSREHASYLYLIPDDIYFGRILVAIFEEIRKRDPKAIHVFCPVYGITFSSQINKRGVSWLRQIRRQWLHDRYLTKNIILHLRKWSKCNLNDLLNAGIVRLVKPREWYLAGFGLVDAAIDEDLLIDTYIRFTPAPNVDRSDSFWKHIQRKGSQYEKLTIHLDKTYKFKAAFGSYAAYTTHGVPLRTLAKRGVPTIATGALNVFARINPPGGASPSHCPSYDQYQFPHGPSLNYGLLNQAQESLERRLSGRLDISTSYMRAELRGKIQNQENIIDSVVIFLHDFYDSAHIYRWTLFESHFQWATQTIDYLVERGIKVSVKPHPNGVSDNKSVITSLMARYAGVENLFWIEPSTANSNIFSLKPRLAVTVYGSVAPEAAYAGIPVLLAGDHPAINFGIGYTAKSKQDYFNCLLNAPELDPSQKERCISFLAQHNKYLFEKRGCSLIAYMGISFERLYQAPESLDAGHVSRYLEAECGDLIDQLEALAHAC